MKNLARVIIRLFVIYLIFLFFNSLQKSLPQFISFLQKTTVSLSQIFTELIPYMSIWIGYGLLLVLLWKKSDSLALMINKNINFSEGNNDLSFDKSLTIGIILIGIYIIVETIPEFFQSLALFFINNTYFKDNTFTGDSNIRQTIHFAMQILKIFLGLILINKNKRITDFFLNISTSKSE